MTLNLQKGNNKYSVADNVDINLDNSKTKTVTISTMSNGDSITLVWKNGCEIRIKKENGSLKVYKSVGGSYNELDYTFNETPSELDNLDTKYFQEI